MAIHINEILDYLDDHPVCCHNGGVESLMEMLHDAYIAHNSIDSEKIRSCFQALDSESENLTLNMANQLHSMICDLCMEHEVLAFSHGIVVGMHLMSEVNYLP